MMKYREREIIINIAYLYCFRTQKSLYYSSRLLLLLWSNYQIRLGGYGEIER
jgi:hypothetical protein